MAYWWNGRIYSRGMKPQYTRSRRLLMIAAENQDWDLVFKILKEAPLPVNSVNSWKLDEFSFNTPLHYAAEGNAPSEVVEELLKRGAWPSLKNASGERPCDIALSKGHLEIARILKPAKHLPFSESQILLIQENLHEVINHRAEKLLQKEPLRLPEISVIFDLPSRELWFPIYGMYGGFSLRFDFSDYPGLIASSWCRVIMGSGQKHFITHESVELIDSGFV